MPRVAAVEHLTLAEADEVRALARAAAMVDGVAPLSERFLVGLAEGGRHVVATDAQGGVAAYGRVRDDRVAELVVHPLARQRGLGTRVLAALIGAAGGSGASGAAGGSRGPGGAAVSGVSGAAGVPGTPGDAGGGSWGALRVWAHGDLAPARALLTRAGLRKIRELHKLSRRLTPADANPTELPEGFVVRPFTRGRDEAAWLAVNAAAFAGHPEQGAVTRADFERLANQPWFDPRGLLLLETTGPNVTLAGSHWTKLDGEPQRVASDGEMAVAGEVYVVAVAPPFQGRGLAGPLTAAGLAHLAAAGVRDVVLYVDADNVAARRTYARAGFESILLDGMYAAAGNGGEPIT